MNYYHINKDTLAIISGPHDVRSTYTKKLTNCGNPELLDLSLYGLVPEVYPELAPGYHYGGEHTVRENMVEVGVEVVPAPTTDEVRAALELALDEHIEQVAAEEQYGTSRVSARASCIGYAGYPNVWQAECLRYAAWIEGCYLRAQQIMGEVMGGQRAIPTEAELLAEMPPMEW